MFFLIQYNRPKGKTITFKKYLEKEEAQKDRLDLELEQNRKSENHEIVLLEALNEEQIHITHSRYF